MIKGLTRIRFENIEQGDKFIYERHNRRAATDYFIMEAKRVLKTQIETQGIDIIKKIHENDLYEYNQNNLKLVNNYNHEKKILIELSDTKWGTIPQDKINQIYEILKS